MEYKYKWLCKYDKIKNQTKYYQLAREATVEDNGEMYFENIDNATGTFTLVKTGTPTHIPNLEYRVDNGNWQTYDMATLPGVEVPSGAKIYFRGDNSTTEQFNAVSGNSFSFRMTTKHNVGGYATSLLVKEGFKTFEYTKAPLYSLAYIFNGDTKLVNANSLILSISKLTSYCYANMFYKCIYLTTTPALPATTLASNCYSNMFAQCVDLTTAPELPATTLALDCYSNMFSGCRALTTAPDLPATELSIYCYYNMFSGCRALTTAPELPATTLASNCYSNMFQGCTGLTTAPALPATTLASNCYYYMFQGCTGLTTAPALPATTLASNCYANMFQGCTSLTEIPEIDAIYGSSYAFYSMFKGCKGLTSVVIPNTTYAAYGHASMFEQCTKLNDVTTMAESWDTNDYSFCLLQVASTGTFTKLKGVEIPEGTSGIPTGWTVKEYVPEVEMYFENIDTVDGAFKLNAFGNPSYTPTLEYKIDNGTWESYGINSNITVPSGSKIYLRGDNETFSTSNNDFYYFSFDANHNVGGYITSLLNKTDYSTYSFNENQSYVFTTLFYEDSKLFNANKLVLNSDNLTERCYARMFWTCSNLQTAPDLPATTLAPYCYYSMFYNCTSLQTAPELPATTLVSGCYSNMFNNCTNLTSVTVWFESYLEDACSNWLLNVSSTGTFNKPGALLIPEGSSGTPVGWDVVAKF